MDGPDGNTVWLPWAVKQREAPEFGTTEDRPGRNVLLREYLCPRTGLRVGTEILREGDEPLHDIRFGAESAK